MFERMTSPYRDELAALREENERLRRAVRRRRARNVVLVLPAAGVTTFVALQGLLPLLNAPSDGRFFLGVAGGALVIAADLAFLVAVLGRPDDDG